MPIRRSLTASAARSDGDVPDAGRRAGWAWLAGADAFVLKQSPERGRLPRRARDVGRRHGDRERVRDDGRSKPVVEHLDRERPLGAPDLGRPVLPDRAARAQELRHELGLERDPRDPAPPALARDRARRRAADEPGDLQRLDQRAAEPRHNRAHPAGDDRDHEDLPGEDRGSAEGDRNRRGQGGNPAEAGNRLEIPRRLRDRRDELLGDPQDWLRAVLQARPPACGNRRSCVEARSARTRGDDRGCPGEDHDVARDRVRAAREPRRRRSGPTATFSPVRPRSSGSRKRIPP